MNHTAILSTGSYLPPTVVHNESMEQFPSTAKLLVSQKTGVFSRRHANEDQCTSDLALEAARRCLERIDFSPGRVEAIVLSTSSPDRIQPATATRLQHLLGAVNAFAFDINSVCSGSVYGIALSHSLISSGLCRNVLFVAAEAYSKILNPNDFSTYPYFGDGSGAILFAADEGEGGVLHSILKTDGSGSEVICVPGGGTMLPTCRIQDSKSAYFHMKGRDVYEFAVSRGTEIILEMLEATKLKASDLKTIICHQANVNILLKIAEHLRIEEHRFYMNLFRYGNTASASVPIALDEAMTRGMLQKGDLLLTVAFGGGLSWGANLIQI